MLLRHMAVLNSPAIFEGGLRHERLGRSARAACRAGTEAITSVICLAISCLSVLLTTMEGISQVCIVCLCGGVASVLLTVGIHPVLMLVGFGPAKVKGRAWALYVWWLSAGCPRPSKEPPEGLLDTDLGSLGESAGQVLGPPFSWVRSTQKQPSPEEPEKEVTVNHLEMQGATAMPPFHGATVHKGLFRGDG
ncbi:Uncharacterized protein SCF082_LOCUS39067 [Durusdinium trenchii]|uniref:H(+)-exporting diphosphatase n=1 Tax=Durusdinium trenchii TaxID=1381693 RepID=A0ABP0Q1N4_9DINO